MGRKNRKPRIPQRPVTAQPDPIDTREPLNPSTLPEFKTASISLLPDFVAQIGTLTADEAIKTASLRELQELFEELQLASSEAVQYTDFLDFASEMQYMFGVVKETRTLIFEDAEVQEPIFGYGNFDTTPATRNTTKIIPSQSTPPLNLSKLQRTNRKSSTTMPTSPGQLPRNSPLDAFPSIDSVENNELKEAVKHLQDAIEDAKPALDAIDDNNTWAQTTQKQSNLVKPKNLDRIWTAFDPLMADKDYLAGSKRKVREYVQKAYNATFSVTSRITKERALVGFVYLTSSKAGVKTLVRDAIDPSAPPCFNIGAALFSPERGWGYAQKALTQMLKLAFGSLGAHRVQAHVVDGPLKMTALRVFNELSFTYEGTQRRALYSPLFANWKDVTTLAVLDTDWMVHQHLLDLGTTVPGRNLELWDAMFERQEHERSILLKRSNASSD